jgi:light-regulated signal transduction histidine kinase (bacteriophytochrome)
MIRQVFQNLISNGIKFSQNKPSPRIELGYKKESERIVFSVSDNGIGFDEQYKNKLFQLFKRLPTQEKFEGIGAGLAIVKRIVERHGGEVWAEGSLNQGAIFYFSLPKLS